MGSLMTATAARVTGAQVGTSGFGYSSWRPAFYPAEARPEEFLRLYAERLPSVELNVTGYRLPSEEQFRRWAAAAPDGFTFAVKMLRAALYRRKLEEQQAAKDALEATKADNSWGSQIRSYVFQPYTMVNDHRTELKIPDVQRIMDGDIDEFIEAYLKQFGAGAGVM